MANDVVTTEPKALTSSLTLYCATTLDALVPEWARDRGIIDAERFYPLVLTIPRGAADGLERAARSYQAAMIPASEQERRGAMVRLRLGTARNRGLSEQEGLAAYETILKHVSDVPADILDEAVDAYMKMAGARFFPSSPGELRAFTDRAMLKRKRRADRLLELAKQSREQDAEAERIERENATPIPLHLIASENALMKRFGLKTRFGPDGLAYQLEPGAVDPCEPEAA